MFFLNEYIYEDDEEEIKKEFNILVPIAVISILIQIINYIINFI